MEKAEKELTFEDAVTRLEQLVSAMESGSLPLDECLRQFEQAVSLSRYCAGKLDAAEKQISVLTAEGMTEAGPEAAWAGSANGTA